LKINGNTTFSGNLKLDFADNYIPNNNMTIIAFKSKSQSSKFSSVETTGLPSNYKVSLAYGANDVKLLIEKSDNSNNGTSSSSKSHHHSSNSRLSSNEDKTSSNMNTNESKKESSTSTNEVKLGWQQKNGTWYYLNQSGAMEYNKYIDGYYLGSNGVWVK